MKTNNKEIIIEKNIINDYDNDQTPINDYESEIEFKDLLKHVIKSKKKNKIQK